MEKHSLSNRKQENGERFYNFLTDIKVLSRNSNFCNQRYPSMLRDRTVGGIKNGHICEKLLADPELTLEKAEEICSTAEKAQKCRVI